MKSVMRNLVIALFCMTFILSCSKNPSPSEDYMILDDVEYVKDFPIHTDLGNAEESGFDIIGMANFKILDSILFVPVKREADGFWQFYSMANKDRVAKLLSIGQGPNEFSNPVLSENQFSITNNGGDVFASIFDNRKGEIYKFNVSKTLLSHHLDMRVVSDNLSKMTLVAKEYGEDGFLCRELSPEMTEQNRFLLKNGNKIVPDVLEKLNRAKISGESAVADMNIISTAIRVHEGLVIEMPIYLNYFNMYTLDGKMSKTICPQEKLIKINEVQSLKESQRIHTFSAINTFSHFFGVSFYNHPWGDEDSGLLKPSQIQFYDYEGHPLAAVNINSNVSFFDIDFSEGYLYVFSSRTDEFVKYNIKELLRQIVVD